MPIYVASSDYISDAFFASLQAKCAALGVVVDRDEFEKDRLKFFRLVKKYDALLNKFLYQNQAKHQNLMHEFIHTDGLSTTEAYVKANEILCAEADQKITNDAFLQKARLLSGAVVSCNELSADEFQNFINEAMHWRCSKTYAPLILQKTDFALQEHNHAFFEYLRKKLNVSEDDAEILRDELEKFNGSLKEFIIKKCNVDISQLEKKRKISRIMLFRESVKRKWKKGHTFFSNYSFSFKFTPKNFIKWNKFKWPAINYSFKGKFRRPSFNFAFRDKLDKFKKNTKKCANFLWQKFHFSSKKSLVLLPFFMMSSSNTDELTAKARVPENKPYRPVWMLSTGNVTQRSPIKIFPDTIPLLAGKVYTTNNYVTNGYISNVSCHRNNYADDIKSVYNTLLDCKPIECQSARISSNYGWRKHPISKRKKLHSGIDYAAPTGSRIYASADGVIESARWTGGYGRYVVIKHNSTYSTAYAHMNGFAKGIKQGKKVKKGQVIGYVGSSGYSTGPHLHFEVIKNGKKVDPLKVNAAIAMKSGASR